MKTRRTAVLCTVLLGSCTAGHSELLEQTETIIDERGGTALSADGLFSVIVPPGALSEKTAIIVATDRTPRERVLSRIYEVEPRELMFRAAARVELRVASDGVEQVLADLGDPLNEAPLPGSIYDRSAALVVAEIARLSSFGAVAVHTREAYIASEVVPPVPPVQKNKIAIYDVSAAEGDSSFQSFHFSVLLKRADCATISLDVTLMDGTATDGDDFHQSTRRIIFPGGPGCAMTETTTVTVLVEGDEDLEPDETFTVTVSNPPLMSNVRFVRDTAVGTIVNDDQAPPPPCPGAIRHFFTGVVVLVDDDDNLLEGIVALNQPVSGHYTFDPAAPDNSADPTVGEYWHSAPCYGMQVDFPAISVAADPANVRYLFGFVNRDRDIWYMNSYNNLGVTLPSGNELEMGIMSLQFDDLTAMNFSSDALIPTPPIVEQWNQDFALSVRVEAPEPLFYDALVRVMISTITE